MRFTLSRAVFEWLPYILCEAYTQRTMGFGWLLLRVEWRW